MSMKLLSLKESFLSKQAQLEIARTTLKSEFFGIDKAIDELINNTRSWYVLNGYQNRPLVVNLWGLTGVGKTSLITRLAELLSYRDRLFKFDLGDKNGNNSFRDNINDVCEKDENEPIIIVLDEFQHCRTLKGPMRTEVDSDANRKVWELIDSGKIDYFNWYHGLSRLSDYVKKLKYFIENGVTVKNGLVVKGWTQYYAEFNEDDAFSVPSNKAEKHFIDTCYYDKIMEYAGAHYNFTLESELKAYLFTLNGEESVDFLIDVIRIASRPQVKNFSKALIFIIGNLDEAYDMSANLSADIDADTFYESSLKITLSQIKRALTARFRNEQIARLGNIHIIYPALNKKAYKNIIQHELEKVKKQTREDLDLELEFEGSVRQLIYKEGVFPTQGVRPLLTTINYLIKTNLPVYFSEILIHNLQVNRLRFVVADKQLICFYSDKNDEVHEKAVYIETPLEDIRVSKKDDMQAITAVHESGHAILSAILLQVVPEHVFSVTTETEASGFVYSKFPWKYVSKKEIVNRVAMFLGGYVAETLVFGEDYVTAGSSSDIQKATSFLSSMYKENGMGESPIFYDLNPNINEYYHDFRKVELQIESVLKQGQELAKTTLMKEMTLLLKVSDYLSDHSSLEKDVLQQMIKEYKVSKVEFLENGDFLYYRNQLKKTLSKRAMSSTLFERVSMNYNNKNE
ncbi:AAA family ATPase [Bizionia sp.]|uniref:AAA family ATPase n=1 Tax=Bizionia sp. TaxID=1954480 RepID=UPI003A8CE8B7